MTKRKKFIVAAVVLFCIAAGILTLVIVLRSSNFYIKIVNKSDDKLYGYKIVASTELSYTNGGVPKTGSYDAVRRVTHEEKEQGKRSVSTMTFRLKKEQYVVGDEPPETLSVSFYVRTEPQTYTDPVETPAIFVNGSPAHIPVKAGRTTVVTVYGNAEDGYYLELG